MTIDHEDLIAEAVRALASNQWTSGWGVESLAERLCDALEATTARLREAEDRAENGSCWDTGPTIPVPPGECAPVSPRCELKAGHLGAHRSRRTEWMRNEHSYNYVAARLREAEACIERAKFAFEHPRDPRAVALEMSLVLATYKSTTENGSER